MPQIEVHEVYLDRAVTLDPRLTSAPPFPPAPEPACIDPTSAQRTLCEEQVHEWLIRIGLALRGAIGQIDEIRALQPEEGQSDR